MKDFLGVNLSVDDVVIMIRPHYRAFVRSKIIRFTKEFVIVEYELHYGSMLTQVKQKPDQLIKVI